MPTDINKGFDNGDLLRDIRVDILNPVTVKTASLERDIAAMKPKVDRSIIDIDSNISSKSITYDKNDGSPPTSVSLAGMFQEGSDLTIVDDNGTQYKKVTKLDVHSAKITQLIPGEVELQYEWDKIVPDNQKRLAIGKTGSASTTNPDALYFKGADITLDESIPGITTVNIPPAQPLMAAISSGTAQPITSIQLEGETSSSTVSNNKLTINLNAGGGGGTVTNQNFKGFFNSLGDLVSNIQDPINGKSFAYVKDSKIGGNYYTAYWYVSNDWTELKQDPALLYTAPSAPTPSGVFSIKPNPGISVDSNGQLDLDGLSTPQLPSHFKGFFDSLADLKTAVPKPVVGQDWAYVKGPGGGWMIYRSGMQGSASKWDVVAPLGSFAVVDKKEGPTSFAQSFGIYKDESWDLDSKGVLSLKPVDTTTNIVISGHDGSTVGGKISNMKFDEGKSFAEVDQSTLVIKNPQRVIEYNNTWELAHNTQDYRGNIFFDTTSRTWMGWCDPEQQGAVGAKWTRIAHADMSLEVKGLTRRFPWKTPEVIPGVTKDNGQWFHNGFTYVPSDNENLPESFRDTNGAYIMTMARGSEDDKFTNTRYQVCYSDADVSECYIRRLKPTSPGSELDWSPWVRTSFSKKDITDHENDPSAHKNIIKYHKVTSFTAKYVNFLTQGGVVPGIAGGFVRGSNCDLITDNYGYTIGADYFEVPYNGQFRLGGEFVISGYSNSMNEYPNGDWVVTLSRNKKDQPGVFETLKAFKYTHSIHKNRYPPLSFFLENVEINEGDKVYVSISFSNPILGISTHPDVYFVPVKSHLYIEDMETRAGSNIAKTYRKHMANLNALGNLEVKAHFLNYAEGSSVRVYGDKVIKDPIEMKPE